MEHIQISERQREIKDLEKRLAIYKKLREKSELSAQDTKFMYSCGDYTDCGNLHLAKNRISACNSQIQAIEQRLKTLRTTPSSGQGIYRDANGFDVVIPRSTTRKQTNTVGNPVRTTKTTTNQSSYSHTPQKRDVSFLYWLGIIIALLSWFSGSGIMFFIAVAFFIIGKVYKND